MLQLTQFTGTKTVKACPMSLGEAEKVLRRTIDTSAVEEDREKVEGYLVEYEDGYRSWSPKEAFEKVYRVSETHLDRMRIEISEVYARYQKGREFLHSQAFGKLSAEKRSTLRMQLDCMENYIRQLSRRIELENEPDPESSDDK